MTWSKQVIQSLPRPVSNATKYEAVRINSILTMRG